MITIFNYYIWLINQSIMLTNHCRLWVIYVREYNYSNVKVMITQLIWTIWTLMSSVPQKADKLNLSLFSLLSVLPLADNELLKVISNWRCLYSAAGQGNKRMWNTLHWTGAFMPLLQTLILQAHQNQSTVVIELWSPISKVIYELKSFARYFQLYKIF